MTLASAALVLRVAAIHDHNRLVVAGLSVLLGLQVVVQGVSCAFFKSVPLAVGQGCIAGPKAEWVGIYWAMPTVLYAVMVRLRISVISLINSVLTLHMWFLVSRIVCPGGHAKCDLPSNKAPSSMETHDA